MLNVFATGTLYTFIKSLRKTLSLKKRKNIGPSRRLGQVIGKICSRKQSWIKYLKQSKEIKENWTGVGNIDI